MCEHTQFDGEININRFEDTRDGDSIRCSVDLRVWCGECKRPLLFALPCGLNLVSGATMSVDGEEARIAGRIGIPKSLGITGFSVSSQGAAAEEMV